MKEEPLVRVAVPEMDAILGKRFDVLDDGFVRVIDYMGSDVSIVQAARVSYGSGTKKVSDDRRLVRYLMRHRHTTPFEMCEIKLHVRVPMDCWRQWIRHRTASVNEYSTRYSVAIETAMHTEPSKWRLQASFDRQGSSGFLDTASGALLSSEEAELQRLSREIYQTRLGMGVAREQARKDLPLSTYTEAYWKIDLHNLLHFLELRMDSHAQEEIRLYANVIGREIVQKWCPFAWEAFEEYRLGSVVLSKWEAGIVARLVCGDHAGAVAIARDAGWLGEGTAGLVRNRERKEAEAKMVVLGLSVPWLDKQTGE